MTNTNFEKVAATEKNTGWKKLINRQSELYSRDDDVRSEFARDYTRILHSMSYRRLKHKTQVFFNIDNDHICTRMEHVSHVESVSSTIAKRLGLNEELTKAISIGHDLGHAPFGHHGELIISDLAKNYLHKDFWHEKNGLRVCDKLELLADPSNKKKNLDLTYAVRDGIISHCGEVDKNGLIPRADYFPLEEFEKPDQFPPVTWEGCVIKMADKIAYIGRDIEDAITLGFLDEDAKIMLSEIACKNGAEAMNTTVIMHNMIIDICNNSSPDAGITLSESLFDQMTALKKFNYEHIYCNDRLKPFEHYSELVLNQIFEYLLETFDKERTWYALEEKRCFTPELIDKFEIWLAQFCDEIIIPPILGCTLQDIAKSCENEKIYGDLSEKTVYIQAILDFISGMTDRYAIKVFNEMISY